MEPATYPPLTSPPAGLIPPAVYVSFAKNGKQKIEVNMADIKSSIELAMERTRNLSLTEEERLAAMAKEWGGKMRGWL